MAPEVWLKPANGSGLGVKSRGVRNTFVLFLGIALSDLWFILISLSAKECCASQSIEYFLRMLLKVWLQRECPFTYCLCLREAWSVTSRSAPRFGRGRHCANPPQPGSSWQSCLRGQRSQARQFTLLGARVQKGSFVVFFFCRG